jgi:L-erythro-3,5-diaminohexanoate dehydrogenase
MTGDAFGLGRVMDEPGVLPQRAQRLDPRLPMRPNELLISVETLNIDAASFKQIEQACGRDEGKVASHVQDIVRTRGKMHNPVTGSGGMLIGRVKEVGAAHPARGRVQAGDRIATLVSLTLTPLQLGQVKRVHLDTGHLDVEGHALLFPTGIYAKLPDDMPQTLALAALDVCGAPALVARHVRPGMTVAVIGAGKSGALCLAQAKRSLKGRGQLVALDVSRPAVDALLGIGLCSQALQVDATRAVDVLGRISDATSGQLCDLVINCASVPNTEMASILSVRDGGTLILFSMATSFTSAALGAEGVGKDVTMLMGNGYAPGHAELTLDLLRTEPELRALFESRYV